jgi:hypothetical protein
MKTTPETIRAIRENCLLALLRIDTIETKQLEGCVKIPLSMAVLTAVEIQTKNAAEVLAEINASIP